MFETYPEIISIKEVANMLHISTGKTYLLIRSKQIPAIKIGRDWKIAKTDIIKYLNFSL